MAASQGSREGGTLATFGWVAAGDDPPDFWDLRERGWSLCNGHGGSRSECRHVLVVDTRGLSPTQRVGLTNADRPAWRLIMLGVEEPSERAQLLTKGCAEALPATTPLRELDARAQRVSDMFGMLPRWRNIGPLTLDLFHRDARKSNKWLNLHPREFGLLWRLSDRPGERVTRRELLRDVWRINHDPETNSVEVHVSRLRGKLAISDCAQLIETVPEGGYRLSRNVPPVTRDHPPLDDALDTYLHGISWPKSKAGQKV